MGKYKGRRGRKAICQRSGFHYPYDQMVKEPGTGYWVHRSESDGIYNLVDHPQNFSPESREEGMALPNAVADTYSGSEFVVNEDIQTPILLEEGGYPLYNEDD